MNWLLALVLNAGPYLVTANGIDRLKLGMPVTDAKRLYPNHKLVEQDDLEGGTSTVFEIYDGGKLIFDAQIEEGKIYNLSSDNPSVRTQEGIGPRSTLSSAEKVYGKPTLVHGEGMTCAVFKDKAPSFSFCLDREAKVIESVAVIPQ